MLDDGDRQIIARMNDLVREVIRLWYGLLQKEPATEATGMLLVRCSASWKSICKILANCQDEDEVELCSHDAAALLRCMHDVCLQAEYIAAGDAVDGRSPDDLGCLFLEYEHVERYRMSTTAVGLSSELADLIRSSPARPMGEAHNQAEYDRVKGDYPNKGHWYPGNLAQVAEKIGLKEEYFWFTTILHSSIHGGPLSCRRGPAIQGAGLTVMAAVAIIRRVIDVVVRMNGLELSAASHEMMTATKGDLLNPLHQLTHRRTKDRTPMQYSRFAIHERPLCVWDWDLAEITRTFLDTFDPGYFEYQVEVHIDQLDGEGARHAATAIRTIYCHAMDTLFALLAATLQAPDCVAGWIQAYRSPELDDLVRKISKREPVLTKHRLPAVNWKELSGIVHRCLTLEDAEKTGRIKDAFGRFWSHLAHDFLSSHARPEYNSIKHGFRVGSGGSYIHAGIEKTPGQACPPEEMKCVGGSEDGSSFYVAEAIGDSKLNVRLRRTSRNWDGVFLALRIKLIGMSLQNVVSCLRIGNGAEPSTVQFRWPEELDIFAEAMRGPSLRESTFGLLIEPKDIVPRDKAEILDIYNAKDAGSSSPD